jgi:hypothetical protein
MILLISTCNEALHEREFVDPIATIGTVRHYNDVTQADIDAADKIIICGTSLKDNSSSMTSRSLNGSRVVRSQFLVSVLGCRLSACSMVPS